MSVIFIVNMEQTQQTLFSSKSLEKELNVVQLYIDHLNTRIAVIV